MTKSTPTTMRPISNAMSLYAETFLSIDQAIVSSPRRNANCAIKRAGAATLRGSNLPPDQRIERPPPAAAHEEMKHDDRPEQRIFDAARFPIVAVVPVIGDDCDDHENNDRTRGKPREQPDREQYPAGEFEDADNPGPHQPVLETGAFEEPSRAFDVAEQDLIAMEGERTASHQADQRLRDRREYRVKAAQRRDEQARRGAAFRFP